MCCFCWRQFRVVDCRIILSKIIFSISFTRLSNIDNLFSICQFLLLSLWTPVFITGVIKRNRLNSNEEFLGTGQPIIRNSTQMIFQVDLVQNRSSLEQLFSEFIYLSRADYWWSRDSLINADYCQLWIIIEISSQFLLTITLNVAVFTSTTIGAENVIMYLWGRVSLIMNAIIVNSGSYLIWWYQASSCW